jgi:ATP-dependent DNA helicase DinG
MKYEEQINNAFELLGFIPREGQREAVDKILTVFLDDKMQNCIISAPTGTGKSLIGAATAEALSLIRNSNPNIIKSSISLVSTNTLATQYSATFAGLEDAGKFVMIKGAGNYSCSALSTGTEQQTADACAWYTMINSKSEFADVINNHCSTCEFLKVKQKKNKVRHLTTNYSYFFIDRMYTGKFETRDLVIWDEAHLINDLFSDHNAIHFSQKKMLAIQEEIAETVRITDVEISRKVASIARDCESAKINDSNYKAYLRALQEIYAYAREAGTEAADTALRSGQMSRYSKLTRFTKKYEGLGCKIDDLFTYEYEHIFEYKKEDKSVSIKPVFVGNMIHPLQCSDHNLFMSATISPEFMVTTLNLDPAKTEFIKLPPTFPKENKEVVFFDPLSLNYKSLQDKSIVKALRKNACKIVKKHIEDGDRGIILTPSFKLQTEIVEELNAQPWNKNYRLFDQRQGEKLEPVLAAFKAWSNGPAVLISPSLYEGIDLPGALSRFQIIVKTPFPSLGDKRIKFILDNHPDIYETIALMKLIQGCGRSIRSSSDFATTYCLDYQSQRLFKSPANIWIDEFSLRFTKFL